MPCLDEATFVLTKDISLGGIGIIANKKIRSGELLVCLWPDENVSESPCFFLGKVRRNSRIGGGFWILGIELMEFANQEHQNVLDVMRPIAEGLLTPTAIDTE